METGHGPASEAPADERAGNRWARPKLPRHLSTLPSGDSDPSTLMVTDSNLKDNSARGGDGAKGGDGGDGLGGGLVVSAGSSATLSDSILTHNRADGGEKGTGGRDGQGVGGAVHGRGTFAFDFVSVIKKNHASTSSDDIDP